jgi:hypothetical protein
MTNRADALLDAHVAHELERLSGAAFDAVIRENVTATFDWLEGVRFRDVVTREQIVAVIERYVIQLRVSGGITELAGEMSNVVFSSSSAASTRVDEVVPPEAYEDFADKIVGLESVHRELFRYVTRSAAFRTLAARLVARTIADLAFRSDDAASRSRRLIEAFGKKLFPGAEERIAAALSRYAEAHAGRLARGGERNLREALDREWLRQMADEIWDEVAAKPLSQAAEIFTPQDLEDFVVLGYEFWLKFRKTRYFATVSAEVVDRLFVKYGSESVRSVISDMGITEEMIAEELRSFLPPLLDRARRTGFLEQRIRARLEPFYRSEAVTALLVRGE